MSKSFKVTHTLEERRKKAQQILQSPKDVIPIVIEFGTKPIPGMEITSKLLNVPRKALTSLVVDYIRKNCVKVPNPSMGFFVFVGRNLVPMHLDIEKVYDAGKDEDGFLYLTVNREETFG